MNLKTINMYNVYRQSVEWIMKHSRGRAETESVVFYCSQSQNKYVILDIMHPEVTKS